MVVFSFISLSIWFYPDLHKGKEKYDFGKRL